MWRGVVVTHTAHTASPPIRSHLGYLVSSFFVNHFWYFRANCCLPLPRKKAVKTRLNWNKHIQNIWLMFASNAQERGWTAPLPVSVMAWYFFPLHFMDVWVVCVCQISSAVGWDKRGICAGPRTVGRELETARLDHNQDIKAYINMLGLCVSCSSSWKLYGWWRVLPPPWWTTCPLTSQCRKTLQNLLQWAPPLQPTLGMLLSLTAVLWCSNTLHMSIYIDLGD